VQDHGCVAGGEEWRVRGEIEGVLCCFVPERLRLCHQSAAVVGLFFYSFCSFALLCFVMRFPYVHTSAASGERDRIVQVGKG
jgi:hypothetical protein